MRIRRPTSPVNRLLKALPLEEQLLVAANSETVELAAGDILCEYNQIPRHVYFPLSGLISLVVSIDDQAPLELAMIGSEGMLGATKILGIREAPMRGVVQLKGQAVRMTVSAFEELSKNGSQLQAVVKRHLFVLMTQLNRAAGCTHFHEVSSRLARWLLMAHDRSPSEKFFLTQQFLSEILGVQRSAVSIAAGKLQERGLINYVRGDITVLDRKALETAACSCYAAIMKDQRRFATLLGTA
ncbi:MAG: Crp/Fnr family transcriptional regulator [Gammaproteobacteria bacterium]|nr:Crp/Fnr family transcriptional regulator [Gammaproteobacteria bacterium]MDP2140751.1 Crp/Fnr family transcriptional regulator [Gammaproteobacteria bacterium]MDP2347005.1 Crp/Fnr family transcriptional regulator [Gammaproteobacteria bacterium]